MRLVQIRKSILVYSKALIRSDPFIRYKCSNFTLLARGVCPC